MQLLGMSTDPVRVVLEVTWWPHDNSWGIARKDWRRVGDREWQLEGMSCSGTALSLSEVSQLLRDAVDVVEHEMTETDDPFSALGAFR